MNVSGTVTIITGASEGVGLATARRFSADGAKVVLAARSAAKLAALAEELRGQGREALAVPTDMCDRAAVNRLVEETARHFGRIDILINNAGQAAAGTAADMREEDFRRIIDLNVFGPLYAMQAAIPVMRRGGGGLIINVSSMVSKMRIPGLGAYAATKVALNMVSETARVELAADKIRVIVVYPRMAATDFGEHSLGDQGLRARQRAATADVPRDSAEAVAEKILEAARKEPEEQYMDR
jgi:NAD(P)-dependent dehydrogenase (short-subunit alcohol dehydrogenase family)